MNTDTEPYILTVFIEDTDITGFVYYANYLKYLERARAMLLYHKGVSHAQLIEKEKLMFVVKSCEVDYKKPARFEDELKIYTSIEEVCGASLKLKQLVVRGTELLVQASISLVCVTLEGKPTRLPSFVTIAFR